MHTRKTLEQAMRRALGLAGLGPANNPNPRVGCILIDKEGTPVAEGWHRGAGTPHAEIDALQKLPEKWMRRKHELTAVITLEPCNHHGKTGPCAAALAASGLQNIAYATKDTGKHSAGGAKHLQAAGIQVQGGILEETAKQFIEDWAKTRTRKTQKQPRTKTSTHTKKPFVTLKWAQTLDGFVAATNGTSKWITGPAARHDAHKRRAQADAIIAGTGTILQDNPALTARTPHGKPLVAAKHQPIPVIFGTRNIPANAQIHTHPALTANKLAAPPQFTPQTGITRALNALAQPEGLHIQHILIEGGPHLAAAFLQENAVDEILVYVAPKLLGQGTSALPGLNLKDIKNALQLQIIETKKLGQDTLYRAKLTTNHKKEPQCSPA